MPMRPPFNPTCRLCGVTRESLQWRRVFGGLKTCSSAVHACCCPQLESCIPPWGPGIVLLAAAARQLPATTSAASGFLPSELNARIRTTAATQLHRHPLVRLPNSFQGDVARPHRLAATVLGARHRSLLCCTGDKCQLHVLVTRVTDHPGPSPLLSASTAATPHTAACDTHHTQL